jgi:hypothetical protein
MCSPQMTKSLISFPANLEMVNNETDVTGCQPGSWCAHYDNGRNNCGFQSFKSMPGMVNNETDVTGCQPGSWCAHYDNGRNNCGFQSFKSMPGCGVGRPRLLHAGLARRIHGRGGPLGRSKAVARAGGGRGAESQRHTTA